MTIKELKEKLNNYPDDFLVLTGEDLQGGFHEAELYPATIKNISVYRERDLLDLHQFQSYHVNPNGKPNAIVIS